MWILKFESIVVEKCTCELQKWKDPYSFSNNYDYFKLYHRFTD